MTPFEHSRAALSDGQTYGIWSLIVTFFGDMAQNQGDKVSGTTLTAVCERLDIKSQAMRVALHRLRKDGWIDSEKTGRRSAYFLTEASRAESIVASSRIYAITAPAYSGTNIAILPAAKRSEGNGWHPISDDVLVSFDTSPTQPEQSIFTHYDGPIPAWLQGALISPEIPDAYCTFLNRLTVAASEDWSGFTTFEIAAMRILIVHSWRRLILRHPNLPDNAFPSSCPVQECRSKVHDLLAILPRPSLEALEKTKL